LHHLALSLGALLLIVGLWKLLTDSKTIARQTIIGTIRKDDDDDDDDEYSLKL
jgi:hypothetical protein